MCYYICNGIFKFLIIFLFITTNETIYFIIGYFNNLHFYSKGKFRYCWHTQHGCNRSNLRQN